MKQLRSKAIFVKVIVLMALFATTSSFTGTWGGDHYRVYVNGKMVSEQFVYNQKSIPTIQLDQRASNDQVSVYYSHCGKVGQARHLTIKDADGKDLKTWNFADGSLDVPMTCRARDIVGLHKGNAKLGMYYSAKELPDGKKLVNIVVGKDVVGMP